MLNFFSVLWQPQATMRNLPNLKVLHLALLLLAFEFGISLMLLGSYSAAISKAVVANPLVTPGMVPVILAIAVSVGALVNPAILLAVAVVFLLVAYVLGQRPAMRDLLGMMILAAVPSLVLRMVRAVALASGLTVDTTAHLVSLSQLMPLATDSPFGKFLSRFDVADVWTMALVVLGFAIVSGLKRTPAIVSAFAIWGLVLLAMARGTGMSA